MSIRYDVTVDWSISPRIIEIDAPSTSITIQDLVDTLRYLEALLDNMDNPYLLDATGKDDLGGGLLVGITAKLRNAKLKFQDRSGPNYIQCEVSGGNLVAVDANGVSMDPIQVSAYTQVIKTSSVSAALVADGGGAEAWDGATSEYQTAGSFGKLMTDTKTGVDKLKKILSVGQCLEDNNG